MKIKHVAFFIVRVSDMKRSRAFYEDVIGLQPLDSGFGETWTEYDIDGATFVITTNAFPEAGPLGGLNAGIAFEVDDVEAWHKKCETAGAKVLIPPTDMPSCFSSILADPDGNVISFHKIHA